MFAPAVTITPVPRATSMPLSRASLSSIAPMSARSPTPSWYACVSGLAIASRATSSAAGGGP